MKKYGKMLKKFLYDSKDENIKEPLKSNNILRNVAVVLIILSFIFYGLIFVVPFLPIALSQKAAAVPVLIILGEGSWWVGIAIVGKEVVMKYKKYLQPWNWFCKKKKAIIKGDGNN